MFYMCFMMFYYIYRVVQRSVADDRLRDCNNVAGIGDNAAGIGNNSAEIGNDHAGLINIAEKVIPC